MKWRVAAQEAIQELYSRVTVEPKPPMGEFLKSFYIDESFLQYDAEGDCFY